MREDQKEQEGERGVTKIEKKNSKKMGNVLFWLRECHREMQQHLVKFSNKDYKVTDKTKRGKRQQNRRKKREWEMNRGPTE